MLLSLRFVKLRFMNVVILVLDIIILLDCNLNTTHSSKYGATVQTIPLTQNRTMNNRRTRRRPNLSASSPAKIRHLCSRFICYILWGIHYSANCEWQRWATSYKNRYIVILCMLLRFSKMDDHWTKRTCFIPLFLSFSSENDQNSVGVF